MLSQRCEEGALRHTHTHTHLLIQRNGFIRHLSLAASRSVPAAKQDNPKPGRTCPVRLHRLTALLQLQQRADWRQLQLTDRGGVGVVGGGKREPKNRRHEQRMMEELKGCIEDSQTSKLQEL